VDGEEGGARRSPLLTAEGFGLGRSADADRDIIVDPDYVID
jgi:hypothetical protein